MLGLGLEPSGLGLGLEPTGLGLGLEPSGLGLGLGLGVGLEPTGLGLGLGLGPSGLDYITVHNTLLLLLLLERTNLHVNINAIKQAIYT